MQQKSVYKKILYTFIHSFIHLLIIPESITGTELIDIELVMPYIVQYLYSSNIYI
jgi:hypothetical protein